MHQLEEECPRLAWQVTRGPGLPGPAPRLRLPLQLLAAPVHASHVMSPEPPKQLTSSTIEGYYIPELPNSDVMDYGCRPEARTRSKSILDAVARAGAGP
ncbi:hypothetical protein MVI01_24010 [Myxococcus virescens]|uniref:Uncharacterized protein n=1 Tax=Myxococcus virescens TaxID=83456 RepID=A0A511HAN3_9BACT|nr:hypothetical protein MVI01_24010 [Myxococcus virescens]